MNRLDQAFAALADPTRRGIVVHLARGEASIEVALPCVVSIQKGVNGIHDKRYPSMKGIMAAKTKPLETIPAPAFEPTLELVKLELPPERPPGRIVGKGIEAVPELVRLLKEEAKVL